jgi:protein involved in polysaccharide export with SLBB domain
MPENRSAGNLATTIRVPLDSTYLFERDSTGRYLGPPGLPFPAPGAAEVELKPYDNVLIFRQPDFELQRSVTIQGEVRFPGTYALRTKSDRLSDVVERAGGLTPRAYPEGVRFIRTAGTTGRVNVDLPAALDDLKSRDNIILQPEDSIFIPEFLPTVKVTGAVNSPGSTLYRPGEGLDYYLSAAGGFARNADKGRVSVRYANGDARTKSHFLWWSSKPTPQPGAEVFVPARDASEQKTNLPVLFGALAQIMASMVAIIVVAIRG